MTSTYKAAFKSFKANVKKAGTDVARDVAFQLAESVILKTPVDTGQARGNWEPGINTIPLETFLNRLSPSGAESVNRAKQIIAGLKIGDEFSIANSLNYIQLLEDGSSKQAPSGMMRITAALFPRMVERAAARRKS